MSTTLTAVLIGVAILPALMLVWLVAVLAKRQAAENEAELQADLRLAEQGLLDEFGHPVEPRPEAQGDSLPPQGDR